MPNRNRQLLDIGAGIVTILLAILVYVDSASIKVIADTTLDARFYPKFLAVLMILLSLIMILRGRDSIIQGGKFILWFCQREQACSGERDTPSGRDAVAVGPICFCH